MSATKSVATVLVGHAHGAGIELFHTPDGEAFAIVPTDNHRETWPVRSSGFRLWLRRLYFSTTSGSANSQAVQDALSTLEGQALFDGYQEHVHLRVAEWKGSHYLDLADTHWRVVEISAAGLARARALARALSAPQGPPRPPGAGTRRITRRSPRIPDRRR